MAKKRSALYELTKGFVNTPMEGQYTFQVEAGAADNIVHRMRVELSKLRGKVRARGLTVLPFKMIVVVIKRGSQQLPVETKDTITLLKTQTQVQQTVEGLERLAIVPPANEPSKESAA